MNRRDLGDALLTGMAPVRSHVLGFVDGVFWNALSRFALIAAPRRSPRPSARALHQRGIFLCSVNLCRFNRGTFKVKAICALYPDGVLMRREDRRIPSVLVRSLLLVTVSIFRMSSMRHSKMQLLVLSMQQLKNEE